jgi:hypothetical protein
MRGIYRGSTIVSGAISGGSDDSYPGDRVSAVFAGGRGNDGTLWYVGVDSKPTIYNIPGNNTTGGICDRGQASSSHGGMILVGLCDGSTRIVTSSITATTWWAACTRNGGDQLGSDW